MTRSFSLKYPGLWAFRFALLACAVFTFATGGQAAIASTSVAPRVAAEDHVTVHITESERLLQEAALQDIRRLRSALIFKPFLPSKLVLPAGDLYNRVTWGSAPVNGSRAIHMDESLESPTDLFDPALPMNAFKSILRPVRLSNGIWFEMQQQHAPWLGEWILMRLDGNVAIEIDGLSSKPLLTQFAESLVRTN